MDTGYVLSWVVALSSGLALTLGLRRGGRPRGWVVVHGGLLVLLAGLTFATGVSSAGRIVGLVWVPTVLLPTLLARQLPRWIGARRYRAASWGARAIALLHPADGWQNQPTAVRVVVALDRGELDRADALIATLPTDSAVGRSLRAHWWRASGRYAEAAEWLDRVQGPDSRMEPSLLSLEIRVAGELGDVPRLVSAVNRAAASLGPSPDQASMALMLASFAGERGLTASLLSSALPDLPDDAAAFWRLTAAQRANECDSEALATLAESTHPVTRAATERRIQRPLAPLAQGERDLCAPALQRIAEDLEQGILAAPSQARPWATWAISAVLLAAFAIEIPGGVENLDNLALIGGLVLPVSMTPGEWWRVITGGLLHFGWLHLTLNVVAILFFGARVERRVGATWVIAVFLLSNVGAMQLVTSTSDATLENPGILIGASGGVMGILGAVLAGVLFRYLRHRSPRERRELFLLLGIVVLQSVFDAATPEVSGPVHTFGLVIGFGLTVGRAALLHALDSARGR